MVKTVKTTAAVYCNQQKLGQISNVQLNQSGDVIEGTGTAEFSVSMNKSPWLLILEDGQGSLFDVWVTSIAGNPFRQQIAFKASRYSP